MKTFRTAVAGAVVSTMLSGCGTGYALSSPDKNKIYGGTAASAQGHMTQLDVPFSFVLDSMLLPITIPWTVWNYVHGDHKRGADKPSAGTGR